MANMLFANNCNTTLNGGITAIATSMVVTSATGFPSPTGSQYFYCTLADAATQTTIEIVKVTAVSGTTFTIVRGQDGTTGTIFASGAVVSLRLVAASLNDFPKLDEANTFTGTITFSTPLLATNMVQSTTSTSGYLSNTDWNTFNGKQAVLVSGTNIKTVNGTSLLGSGDVGTIGVSYGGTGLTSFTNKGIPYATSTSALATSSALLFDGQNIGVGITPYAWGTGNQSIDIGSWISFSGATGANTSWNAYYDGTNWKRKLPYGVGCSLYTAGDQSHRFQYAASGAQNSTISWSDAFRTDSTGTLITYAGVKFGGGTSTTLDDYEEGTWTPDIGGVATYGAQDGRYTKIGNFVKLRFLLVVSVKGTGSATTITGMPFTPSGNSPTITGGVVCYAGGLAVSANILGVYCQNNASIAFFSRDSAGTGATTQQVAVIGNGFSAYCEISYMVD